jgi:hypothetical protein
VHEGLGRGGGQRVREGEQQLVNFLDVNGTVKEDSENVSQGGSFIVMSLVSRRSS